eukprot:3137154-Heterocapsa_arctica.AAC.1
MSSSISATLYFFKAEGDGETSAAAGRCSVGFAINFEVALRKAGPGLSVGGGIGTSSARGT